ncbi:MAG: carotenoid biosynthesis protein [Acidimicrobiales bacterium]|nr:carotenoid biosynthesis protein [Acidimicrobiales bacterium]
MLGEVLGTVAGRWYVTAFGVTFLVLAVRHLGWRRTGLYTAIAVVVGILAENGSVHLGIPYTSYSFNEDLRGHELFVGDVPLMVSLSYTFMAYFAFETARIVVAGPYRTRSPMPALEFLVAVMLAVWALWIVDPVSRLGAHFFLGELFRYRGPGFWFGLPLGSQLGFALTSTILIGLLTYLNRDEPDAVVRRVWEHPSLPAVAGYLGQVLFMTVTAFVVARTNGDPAVVQVADALAGSTFVIGVPAVLLVTVHWRSLTLSRRTRQLAQPSGADHSELSSNTHRDPASTLP